VAFKNWLKVCGMTLQTTPNGNYNFTTLSRPTVYLIFWGQYWNQGTNQTQARTLDTDARAILASPYLSQLTDYGSDGKAFAGGAQAYVDSSSDPIWPTYTDPSGITKTANAGDDHGAGVIQSEIANAIANSGGPDPAPARQ
jgi:hypothetical protein